MNYQNNNDCVCRLCSSEFNLVRMFRKNSQNIGDYFRKVIWNIIGIRIEPIDEATSVCFDCLLDLNNFYYFKLTCLEKQKEIEQMYLFKNSKKLKLDYTAVENLPTPNKEKSEEIFQWLDLKGAKSVKKFEDTFSQTLNETLDASTQSEVEPLTIQQTNSTQTSFKGNEVSTQCEFIEIKTESKCLPLDNLKKRTENKHSQTTERTGISSKVNGAVVQHKLPFEPTRLRSSCKVDKKCQTDSKSFLKMYSSKKLNKKIQTDPLLRKSTSVQGNLNNVSQLTQHSPEKVVRLKKSICKAEKDPSIESPISTTPQKHEVVTPPFETNSMLVDQVSEELIDVCPLCATVSYSKRQVKLHLKTHKRCKFCKLVFRTLNEAQVHTKECAFTQLPNVELNRIELVPDIREKYPKLFC